MRMNPVILKTIFKCMYVWSEARIVHIMNDAFITEDNRREKKCIWNPTFDESNAIEDRSKREVYLSQSDEVLAKLSI